MSGFWRYPRLAAVTGNELLVASDAQGTQTVTITLGQIAGAPATSEASGQFYADRGAGISRRADRLLIGAAADNEASSTRDTTQTDWLSALMASTSIGAWPVWGATAASLTRFGSIGFLAASHTSQVAANKAMLGYLPSSIGIASWGVADDTTNPTNATAYAYYGEAWRMAGVNYQPTFGMELEAVNFGGVPTGESTPFHPNNGGGTYGIQLGSGGGQTSGTSDAEAGIVLVSNPNRYRTGVIFAAGSLTGDDSGSGDGAGMAVNLAPGHIIGWCTPETVQNVQGAEGGFTIQSQVKTATKGSRIIAQDGSVSITTSEGNAVASVIMPDGTPTNTLQVQAGVGQQAAGLYVAEGSGGSGNLGLYPADGGELQITSPVTGSGSSLANNEVPQGWLHININGTDYRIPLFSAAQAGG
ncbi:hypothetical protein HKD24_06125 [Gluconobacter sp. LMG 31484]|uniref:Tail fiber protein n=1 Tax=Gluconobacter vitians TaxID=2728102 RepID=A0ABR9Y4D3_9PROT|nr:hypothetical protein [Gluconobacter vitians]MBF0858789.1 hypothetical protein [Gluconobacter vitians]